ncbi:hypothetical protein EXU30_00575 [Shewanella maritima]|uniref:Uncharacterized protein n=1 Tax=Shewanella maritima TaxID=2520507 RepID=A0A411PCR2_9GAMM|nr:hypothetical protein [Shewanella maritima]QBF81355.1 hypothetical protein EXU30_00575 [Shewanella maritima]
MAHANNESSQQTKASGKTIVIESQVTGTSEQPKVIYIMPWQGIDQAIRVEGAQSQIQLPQFRPINPKQFQQRVLDYSLQNKSTQN